MVRQRGGGLSTVHVAADEQTGEAAAINHIHSLPVERAFNLHAELHIACGRCLPTFLRSLVQPGLDRVRVSGGDEGGLETHKSFQFHMFN